MALLAICIPITAGKTEQFQRFVDELNGPRHAEFEAARRALNVRERTFLQSGPEGNMIIVTLEGDDPETALGSFGDARDEFTDWFVAQVKECHGIDLRSALPGQLPRMIADSRHSERLISI